MSSQKDKNIDEFSNFKAVLKKAQGLKHVGELKLSSRSDKKYMIYDELTKKWVHFGQMGYEDFTKHRNIKRRHQFRERNHKWKDAPQNTPAFLSYYLLW